MTDHHIWVRDLAEQLPRFLRSLQVPGQPGRFLPCKYGLTAQGESLALGPSCFALKLSHIIGHWERLPAHEQAGWIAFIQSFQVEGNPRREAVGENAFIDPAVVTYLDWATSGMKTRIKRLLGRPTLSPSYTALTISSETKQAIATLAQVDAHPRRPYRGFPGTPAEAEQYLSGMDWSQPWGAGAHLATLAVFYRTQAPLVLGAQEAEALLETCRVFAKNVLDVSTGAYFKGALPDHGQLINGAMKVLTALDWLEEPIHLPERLIDTCLLQPPQPEGCHLVDAVYVLYRCSRQTDHRAQAIHRYLDDTLGMIHAHFMAEEGAFSYYVNRSQTDYYGVPITHGAPHADIHGTLLLTWAIAMIMVLMPESHLSWKVIRP